MRKIARIDNIIIYTLTTCVLFFIISSMFFNRTSDLYRAHSFSYIRDPEPDSAFIDTLTATLPHNVYKHLHDSAWHATDHLRHLNDGFLEGFSIAGIGLYSFENCIGCKTRLDFEETARIDTTWYLTVSEYQFKQELSPISHNPPVFFRKEGKNYVKLEDTLTTDGELHLSAVVKEVPFRYDASSKSVRFQISKPAYYISWLLLIVFTMLISGGMLWSIVLMIRLSFSIAQGAFFTEENKLRLTFCAWYMLCATLAPLLLQAVIRLWHYNITKAWFTSDTSELVQTGWFIATIICWMLYKAFNKGLQLQQEHDLTV